MRVDLVLDAIKTGHKNGSIAEVWVAGRVGVAQLEAALVGALCVCGDADDCAAVGGCVANGNGCFEAGHQSLEGVGLHCK